MNLLCACMHVCEFCMLCMVVLRMCLVVVFLYQCRTLSRGEKCSILTSL